MTAQANNQELNNIYIKQPRKKSGLWDIFWAGFWILLIVFIILKFFVYQQVTVVGASMEPNYYTGQLLMVNQLEHSCQRGQVVAIYEDKNVAKTADYWTRFQTRFFLKRCIGLPGEEVEMVGNKVIIYNKEFPEGRVLKEDYISNSVKQREDTSNYYFPRTKIAEDNYFMLGDNRTNSTDSRSPSLGSVPSYSIFGTESIRFWPTDKIGVFYRPNYEYQNISADLKIKRDALRSQKL